MSSDVNGLSETGNTSEVFHCRSKSLPKQPMLNSTTKSGTLSFEDNEACDDMWWLIYDKSTREKTYPLVGK